MNTYLIILRQGYQITVEADDFAEAYNMYKYPEDIMQMTMIITEL